MNRRNEQILRQKSCDGLGVTYAEPNLKSLWHDASEEPQDDNWRILCVDDFDSFWVESKANVLRFHNNWDEYTAVFCVKMWAYIDNLLPKQFRKYEQVKGDKK